MRLAPRFDGAFYLSGISLTDCRSVLPATPALRFVGKVRQTNVSISGQHVAPTKTGCRMLDIKFQLQQLATDFGARLSETEREAAKKVSKAQARVALNRAALAEERTQCYRAVYDNRILCPQCWISTGTEVPMLLNKVQEKAASYTCYRCRDTYVLET